MAANAAVFEFKDMDKLRKAFSRFPEKVEKKVVRGTLGAMARVIRKEQLSRIPVELGHLRNSLMRGGIKTKLFPSKSYGYSIIAPKSQWIPVPKNVRWTKGGNVNPAMYAHLTGGNAKGMGRGPKRGWFVRGFKAGVPQAKTKFFKTMQRGIEREARKLGFK